MMPRKIRTKPGCMHPQPNRSILKTRESLNGREFLPKSDSDLTATTVILFHHDVSGGVDCQLTRRECANSSTDVLFSTTHFTFERASLLAS